MFQTLVIVIIVRIYGYYGTMACTEMADRVAGSMVPVIAMRLSPDDTDFPVRSRFTVICEVKTPEPLASWISQTSLYPGQMYFFVNNSRKEVCADGKDKNIKTCSLNMTSLKPETTRLVCQARNQWKCGYRVLLINTKVFKPPLIAEQPPRHINVSEGLDLNITCASHELPRPVITWYRNGVQLKDHKVTWYRGKSTLMLTSIDPSLQGRYRCKANNTLGEIFSNASLVTVFSQPSVTLSPLNQSVAIGRKVKIICNVTGLPVPVIGWLKDGQNLATGSEEFQSGVSSIRATPIRSTDTSGVSSIRATPIRSTDTSGVSSIRATPIRSTDTSGVSSIRATPIRSTDTSGVSSIRATPIRSTDTSGVSSFSDTPIRSTDTSEINARRSARIINVTHSDIVTSQTVHPLPSSSLTAPPTKRPFTGIIKQSGKISTLVFTSTSKYDQGEYQCSARNALGNTTSSSAFLTVYQLVPPSFTENPTNCSALRGMNITMNCTAVGMPTPFITWYKNHSRIIVKERVTIETMLVQSVLLVTSVSAEDEGMYSCKATSSAGSAESRAVFLRVDEHPHSIQAPLGEDTEKGTVWAVTAGLVAILVVILMSIVFIKRKRNQSWQTADITVFTPWKSFDGSDPKRRGIGNQALDLPCDDQLYLRFMGLDRNWEIPRDRIQISDERLGNGCFGNVNKGCYTRKDGKMMPVAIKMLKERTDKENCDDLLVELEILKQVGRHPNIVSLIGACTCNEPLCIVIEFVEGGSLSELLPKTRLPGKRTVYQNLRSSLTDRDLVRLAADISRGMMYLHQKQCIHRDLAARNVLIGKGLVAKIADFGLARHVTENGLYVKTSGGKVPWKWMSPEALRGVFTTKSDVWSFGVLLWEIVTLGDPPYPLISQVVSLHNLLSDGYRMQKPPQCDELLYSVMLWCWSAEADKRPAFDDIYHTLKETLNQNKRTYINLDQMYEEQLEHSF